MANFNDDDHTTSTRQKIDDDELSDLLGGRYEILEILGRGGMGLVLKARHAKLSKLVAIKLLDAALLVDEVSRSRFEQEAKAGSQLTHPNLISVFDYGFSQMNEPYLVMEYVEGESLDQTLASKHTLTPPEFVTIFTQTCKAIQFIHKNNIIHRDIKCGNIMLQTIDEECYVKLLDFGIAKVLDETGGTIQSLTTTGFALGSPPYMSPEQCMGQKTDNRSDLYSLGCVMYECLAGSPPFTGANALQILHMQTKSNPNPLVFRNAVSRQLASIVHRCLEKNPDDRFQTATELLKALTATASQMDAMDATDPIFSSSKVVPLGTDTLTPQSANRSELPESPRSLKGAFPRKERVAPSVDNSQAATGKDVAAHIMGITDRTDNVTINLPPAVNNSENDRDPLSKVRARAKADIKNTGLANEIWQGTSVNETAKDDSKSGARPDRNKLRHLGETSEKSAPPGILIALIIIIPLSIACTICAIMGIPPFPKHEKQAQTVNSATPQTPADDTIEGDEIIDEEIGTEDGSSAAPSGAKSKGESDKKPGPSIKHSNQDDISSKKTVTANPPEKEKIKTTDRPLHQHNSLVQERTKKTKPKPKPITTPPKKAQKTPMRTPTSSKQSADSPVIIDWTKMNFGK